MQLTVFGCAGTFPGPDSPCSSYLVEHDGFRLVVDLGAGALGQLQRHIGLLDVDAIYISHLPSDHCLHLLAYSYALPYPPDRVAPPPPAPGPAGTPDPPLAPPGCPAFAPACDPQPRSASCPPHALPAKTRSSPSNRSGTSASRAGSTWL